MVVLFLNGCIWTKLVVFGKTVCTWVKGFIFGEKNFVLEKNGGFLTNVVGFSRNDCI